MSTSTHSRLGAVGRNEMTLAAGNGRLVDASGNPMPTTAEQSRAKSIKQVRAKLRAAYDAARTTSENAKHWQYSDQLSAAEANSLQVRRTLRARARYECLENNSFGKGMVATLANDFVSTGPSLQMQTDNKALNRRLETLWRRWAKRVSLVRKLRTARLTKCVDGEAFILATTNPRLRDPVQLDLRLVESDQISTPGWHDTMDPRAVDGIKFDRWGNPSEYHMLPYHPGDRHQWTQINDYDRLDPDQVIHLFAATRPGQVRGVPEVTPALPLFAFLRRYTLASVLAAETAADFVAILQTQANAFNQDETQPQDPFESVDIDRGMMTALPYGYELSQLKAEQPTTTYLEFRNALLQEIARCIHMPTNKARGDSSGYNFSSARMDHQIYYHAIETERVDWENEALDRIFGWWLDELMLARPQEFADMGAVEEMPHRWSWQPAISVNPIQDAQAAIKLIEAGLLTRREYLMEHNRDPETHFEEWHAEQQEFANANSQPQGASPGSDSGARSGV
jgi:lambda family phage portal protein